MSESMTFWQTMAAIQIDDNDCPFIKIYDLINKDDQLPFEKWRDIAPRLGISQQDVQAIENKIIFHKFSPQSVYLELLRLWREKQGNCATVGRLIEVLESVKLKVCADSLREHFGILKLNRTISTPCGSQGTTTKLRTYSLDTESQVEMATKQGEYIKANLPKLINLTMVNTSVIAKLIAVGVLSDNDSEDLDAIRNKTEKNKRFYDILRTRTGYYEILIDAMKDTCQNGVQAVLENFYNSY